MHVQTGDLLLAFKSGFRQFEPNVSLLPEKVLDKAVH